MNDEDGTDLMDQEERYYEGGARRKKRGPAGCIAALVALAVIVGGFYFAVTRGVEFISDQFGSPEDYAGPGEGEVLFEVNPGDVAAQIGRNLKDEGVVASVEAFIDAARANPDSSGIQPGTYALAEKMRAADALEILVDPGNQVKTTVTVPEGMRVEDVVQLLAKETEFGVRKWEKALEKDIGLPDYAEGNPEGYLFPATYEIAPKDKPVDLLRAMVARWRQAADSAGLEQRASELGYTPSELMIVASLVEAEGRGDDMPKIARTIYNRLENPQNGITNGKLQIDASVNYGLDQKLGVGLTREQLQLDTPYNTYTRAGLPPTPIEAPGDGAIAAAANPADGPWLFWVTVNLETGETKFTDDYQEFLGFDRELCERHPETC